MPARSTARFANQDAAAAHYGFKSRRFKLLVAIGKEARDLLPYDHPEQMPGWWERMQQAGRLKYKCPQDVLDRAGESVAPLPEKAVPAVKKAAKRGPSAPETGLRHGKAPEVQHERVSQPVALYDGDQVSHGQMVAAERQLFQTVNRIYTEEITTNGIDTPKAQALFRRRQELLASVESLAKSAKHFREDGEFIKKEEVLQDAAVFASGLVQCLRAELMKQFPRADYERVNRALDSLAVRIPEVLPKRFTAA